MSVTQNNIDSCISDLEITKAELSTTYSRRALNGIYSDSLENSIVKIQVLLDQFRNYDLTIYPDSYYFCLKSESKKYCGNVNLTTPTTPSVSPNEGVYQAILIPLGDEATDIVTEEGRFTFRMPFAFNLTSIKASVNIAPTGSPITIDINKEGTSILSTLLTIDAGDKTSVGATTPPVIVLTAFADDVEMSIDITTIGSGVAGTGLKVALIGTQL
jgi:hypothetical protein